MQGMLRLIAISFALLNIIVDGYLVVVYPDPAYIVSIIAWIVVIILEWEYMKK